jgi:hypothetical protein
VVPVRLSRPSAEVVRVSVESGDASARAGSGDYVPLASRELVFAPGETEASVVVEVAGDGVVEPDEWLAVKLSRPVGATLADGVGQVSIVDDDVARWVYVRDAVVTEPGSGSVEVGVVVELSDPSPVPVSVRVVTANGSAVAGRDFEAVAVDVRFEPGETVAVVGVPVRADQVAEGDEGFVVRLTKPKGALLGDSSARITVLGA